MSLLGNLIMFIKNCPVVKHQVSDTRLCQGPVCKLFPEGTWCLIRMGAWDTVEGLLGTREQWVKSINNFEEFEEKLLRVYDAWY